jgi:hypothetical protein
MKKHTFQVTYKNRAKIIVSAQNPPKGWVPEDVIRLSFENKQFDLQPDPIMMRLDEAQTVITLLSEAIHYCLINKVKE